MKELLQAHNKMLVGIALLMTGAVLLSFDGLIPGSQLIPAIAVAIAGNQFLLCDQITSAIRRIESPTRAEKQHWLDLGKGIGYREARRAPRPVTLLRGDEVPTQYESFLSS